MGALGTPLGTALTAVAAVNVSSMMKGALQPTLFLAITLKLYDESFLSPRISNDVIDDVPTCFHDFLPTSRRSTMYDVIGDPPSLSGTFHRSCIESSDCHSTAAGPVGGDGLSGIQNKVCSINWETA